MDNPNKLFRNKGKDQLDIPLFGNSSTLEFCSIQDSMWETNFERSLVKYKYDSDLKKTDINTNRLESYLLDSLWCNLHNSLKSEERNHVVQGFQPYILPAIQTTPAFQVSPPVPNPPRQMDASF